MAKDETKKTNGLAVFFPGIGYTCDRSLLYYTAIMMKELGYRIVPVPYTGFPRNVKGDAQKMRECYVIARNQATEILRDIDFSEYNDIVFIGKSIGTTVALAIAKQFDLTVRSVLYTPLVETFDMLPEKPCDRAIAFHGTRDPWANTQEIIAACEIRGIPLHLVENANHSLETGDLDNDLHTLKETMRLVRKFFDDDR